MTKRQMYLVKYRKEHKQEIKEYEANRYKKNRARILSRNKKWNSEHKDIVSQISREWDKKNPERRAANGARWDIENPDRVKAKWHRRQVKKRKSGGSFTATEWTELCQRYKYKCLCCKRRKPLEADHVIPVILGGSSNSSNIQPLCRSCNAKKSDKVIDYRPKE